MGVPRSLHTIGRSSPRGSPKMPITVGNVTCTHPFLDLHGAGRPRVAPRRMFEGALVRGARGDQREDRGLKTGLQCGLTRGSMSWRRRNSPHGPRSWSRGQDHKPPKIALPLVRKTQALHSSDGSPLPVGTAKRLAEVSYAGGLHRHPGRQGELILIPSGWRDPCVRERHIHSSGPNRKRASHCELAMVSKIQIETTTNNSSLRSSFPNRPNPTP